MLFSLAFHTELICQSIHIFFIGGFRNLYASCFLAIAYDESSIRHKVKNVCKSLPSDFVSLVDVMYKDKPIYSKVLWGIPCAEEEFDTWFSSCPFKMELINFNDFEDKEQTFADELPNIDTVEKVKKDWNLWGHFMENIRLSWIMVNKRHIYMKRLSTWCLYIYLYKYFFYLIVRFCF